MVISGILWHKKAIGVAWHKLAEGENILEIDVLDKKGNRLYPNKYRVNKKELLERYGPLETINKSDLIGIFIPLRDLQNYTIEVLP